MEDFHIFLLTIGMEFYIEMETAKGDNMWHRHKECILVFLGIIAFCVLMAWLVFASIEERREQTRFFIKSRCKIVEEKEGTSGSVVGPVIGSNGSVGVGFGVVSTSGQVCWQCPDGKRYWVNK